MSTGKEGLPLPIWAAIFSTLCMLVGWNWDISWHRSIGRDTIWTPAHIAIYISLAVAFLYNAWLVLAHTFGRHNQLRAIRVLGFRGPSGAFVTLWSVLLQFTAILFDDWWHGVYGLDITVFSPPHFLLGWGVNIFYIGQFILAVLYRNVTLPDHEKSSRWVAIILWSFLLGHIIIGLDPALGPMAVRTYDLLISSAMIFPFVFMLIDAFLKWKWASSVCAGLYMLGAILLMQIFQLFPATPGFGPVYHHLPNFLPPPFPLVLVIPALVMSTVLIRRTQGGRLVTFLLLGLAFVISFNGTNWLSSSFLMSEWADNRFFGGGYPAGFFELDFRPSKYFGLNAASAITFGISVIISAVSSYFGMVSGKWLRRVVR